MAKHGIGAHCTSVIRQMAWDAKLYSLTAYVGWRVDTCTGTS